MAGTVLSRDKPIVIIAEPGRESEAATRLGRIGFDHVVGYLEGGVHSVEERPISRRDRACQRTGRRGSGRGGVDGERANATSTCARRASATQKRIAAASHS